jgi:hypothetical protein
MKVILAVAAPAIVLAACAGGPSFMSTSASSSGYWASSGGSITEFKRDNLICSSRAQRAGHVATAPENAFDRPPQKWPNATAQDIYEACMGDSGWRAR